MCLTGRRPAPGAVTVRCCRSRRTTSGRQRGKDQERQGRRTLPGERDRSHEGSRQNARSPHVAMSGRCYGAPHDGATSHRHPAGEALVHAWIHAGTEMTVLRHRSVVLAEGLAGSAGGVGSQCAAWDDEERACGEDSDDELLQRTSSSGLRIGSSELRPDVGQECTARCGGPVKTGGAASRTRCRCDSNPCSRPEVRLCTHLSYRRLRFEAERTTSPSGTPDCCCSFGADCRLPGQPSGQQIGAPV